MKAVFYIFCLVFTSLSVWGNGGGYAPRGGSGGNVLPFMMEGVSAVAMEEEDLGIELWMTYAHVTVRYKLKNTTDAPVNIRFGFPVETCDPGESKNIVYDDNLPGSRKDLKSPVRFYKATLNGQKLNHELELQSQPLEEDRKSGLSLYGWLVSSMTMKPQEEAELCIETEMKYVCENPFASISENTYRSNQKMIYRLSTAAVWNGPIKRGTVSIRAKAIDYNDVVFKNPVNRFKREGDQWVWEFRDLEPALKDDLVVEVSPDMEEKGSPSVSGKEWGKRNEADIVLERGNKWYRGVSSDTFEITTSSNREGEAMKLHDASERAFWVSGKQESGKEEILTITLKEPQKLGGISVDTGKGNDYEGIKQMKFIVNGGMWSRVVRFEKNQEDNSEMRWISLEECPEKISTLQLVIQSTYPDKGKTGRVGIAGLDLYRKLNKKPVIEPCR